MKKNKPKPMARCFVAGEVVWDENNTPFLVNPFANQLHIGEQACINYYASRGINLQFGKLFQENSMPSRKRPIEKINKNKDCDCKQP